MKRDHTPTRPLNPERVARALDVLRRGMTTRRASDGSLTVEIELGHTRLTREFASPDELERHGIDAVTGLVRDALVELLTRRPAHTTDMGMGSIEDDLTELDGHAAAVDILSTQAFLLEELPLLEPELIEAVDPVQSFRIPEGPGEPDPTRSGHATTLIDQAELHRRLHGTPMNLRTKDVERAHATLVPGNYETASLNDLHGPKLIEAIMQGLTSHGYPDALVFEVADGQISIQLQMGLEAVITPTEKLRQNLMGTLADTITRARAAGSMPER